MGRASGLGTLVKIASGQEETVFHLGNQMKTVGFGQGAWIGNFGEDGVKAKVNNFSFGNPKRKQ